MKFQISFCNYVPDKVFISVRFSMQYIMNNLDCVSYIEQSYIESINQLLQDPLNQDILEYVQENKQVRFKQLKEEFVETGIRKQDLEKNVYKLYKCNLLSVDFIWAEDGHLRAEYSYANCNSRIDELVDNAISSDNFF